MGGVDGIRPIVRPVSLLQLQLVDERVFVIDGDLPLGGTHFNSGG